MSAKYVYFMRCPSIFRQRAASQALMKGFARGVVPEAWRGCIDDLSPPPISNTGGMGAIENNGLVYVQIGRGKGKKNVLVPAVTKNVSERVGFVDWINFSFKVDDFYRCYPQSIGVSNDKGDCVYSISMVLVKIFGFGVTSGRLPGINFYRDKFVLGDNWGFLLIGGDNQKGTVTIMLNGQGCTASKNGWRYRLHEFLDDLGGKITRIDLTADFFKGQYSVDKAMSDYDNGLFHLRGKNPKANLNKPLGKSDAGRTLYIGSKDSGKELCIYEKGKQLGGGFTELFSDWTRVELRLFSRDRVVPLDVLLAPGQYLAGGYPALNFMKVVQRKINTVKNKTKIEIERGLAIAKKQFGKWIFAAAALTGSVAGLVVEELPARLIVPDYKFKQLEELNYVELQGVYRFDYE